MSNDAAVQVILRIPGAWSHPRELIDALPEGCRLTPEEFFLPDGTKFDFTPMPADPQFAQIFRSSCRRPARPAELATVDRYTVNACLSGPGGSRQAAQRIMQAAAAIVHAGGAGVFIDNSTVAHGGADWLEMTNDGGSEALTFAFVAIVGGREDAWTMGMHVLGLPDVVMKSAEAEAEDFGIIDVLNYLAQSDKPVEDGHLLADANGPRFQACAAESPRQPGPPLYNPFGRLRLKSLREIAQSN